jgi:hypothetical protein
MTPTRGFFTFAQNNGVVDYVRMAYALSLSLKHTQHKITSLSIGITPGTKIPKNYEWAFDNIIEIPWSDISAPFTRKIYNEWKAVYMSPYYQTIKLDADMLFTRDITPWWELMSTSDFWICNSVTGQDSRKFFIERNMPDVYAAFMFFQKNAGGYKHFKMAEQVFIFWELLAQPCLGYKYSRPDITTDMAYSLTLKLTDLTQEWNVKNQFPTFIQHDPKVKDISMSDSGKLLINGLPLTVPLHHRCDSILVDNYINHLEQLLGVSNNV